MADAPDKLEPKIKLARPVRILLALLVLIAALFFLLAGIAILSGDRTQMPSPQGALVMALILVALGLGFGYIAVRLIRIGEPSAYLFGARAARIAGLLISVLGLFAAIGATYYKMTDSALAGLALIAIGYRLYQSGQRRRAASKHEAAEHQPPKTAAGGAGIDPASAGTPGAIPASRSHALGWTVAIVVAVAAGILALNSYRSAPSSQWMTSAQYQREFDTWGQKGFYPHQVEGECQSGGEKFRADWRAIPPGAAFFAHHGMTGRDYERREQEYRSRGYALETVKHFKDCSGADRYQATWLRR